MSHSLALAEPSINLSRTVHHKQCTAKHCQSSTSLSLCAAVSSLNQRLHTPSTHSHLAATRSAAPQEQATTSHHTSHQSSHRPNLNTIPRANPHRPHPQSTNSQHSQPEHVATTSWPSCEQHSSQRNSARRWCQYNCGENNYSFDALQAYCFRINMSPK